jgi:predicted membrane protein
MNLFDNLASVGITTSILQYAVFAIICIFILGFIWKYVLIGAGIFFCVYVLAMPVMGVKNETTSNANATVTLRDPVEVEESRIKKEMDRNKPLFLTDCQRYGDYTKQECEKIWNDR